MNKLAQKIAGDLTSNPFKLFLINIEKWKVNNMKIYLFKSQLKKLSKE